MKTGGLQSLAIPKTPAVLTTIVLASGEDARYPDGPQASLLAHIENASLLVCPKDSLSDAARAAILEPAVTKVILVGAEASLSSSVYNQVRSLKPGLSLRRISGADRYATAEDLYNSYSQSTWADTAVLVSGNSFADAISIAPFAAQNHYPVLYTSPDGLSTNSAAILKQGNFTRLLIIGSSASVSDATLAQAQKATGLSPNQIVRLAGSDRFATSRAVYNWTISAERDPSERMQANQLALTRGDKHVDALSACLLQANSTAPILLVTPQLDDTTRALLSADAANINEIRFLGDNSSLPEQLIKDCINILNANRNLTVVWAPDNSVAVAL